MPNEDKAAKVQAEKERLLKLFEEVEPKKRSFVLRQVEALAWYTVSVQELQEQIDADGTSMFYDNGGGQTGTRVNPDIKTVCDFQKHINSISKLLLECLPAGVEKESRLAKAIAEIQAAL